MPKISKKQCERIHAARRAKQRYNLEYTKEIREFIKYKIYNNKTILIRRQSNTRTIRLLDIEEYFYKIVWDSSRKEVVTFLPFEEEDLKYIENPDLVLEEQETISRKHNTFKQKSKKFVTENEEILGCVNSFKDFMFQIESTQDNNEQN
jgi:hypothetical protein